MSNAHQLFAELEATLTNGDRSAALHDPAQNHGPVSGRRRYLFRRSCRRVRRTDEPPDRADRTTGADRTERQAARPIDRAPVNVIGRLSYDDDIDIAGPILEQSNVLTDDDLVEIASTKSQAPSLRDRRPRQHQRTDHRRADQPRQRRSRAQGHRERGRAVFPIPASTRRSTRAERDDSLALRGRQPDRSAHRSARATGPQGHRDRSAASCWRTRVPRCGSGSPTCWPRFPIKWRARWRRPAPQRPARP